MIRNLFKRIAEIVTGSSKDDDSSAIPFAELSRKKAEEQAKKERAERKRRSRDKKGTEPKTGAAKPKRGETRQRSERKTSKQTPDRRSPEGPKSRKEAAAPRNGRPAKKKRPEREPLSNKVTPKKSDTPRQPRKRAWSLDEFVVPEKEGEVRFHEFDLPIKLMHGIAELGFQYATPIQAGCLPETLKGRDAIGKAQTGTGKSAAFLITIINHIGKHPMRGGPEKSFPRALILAPTRELALQIEKDARDLCRFTPYTVVSLFGGTGYDKQKKGMAGSVDIVVATPGRLIDFKNQRLVDLSRVEILVIDEADRMLDMGFIPDIRKIVYATPPKEQRQTLFFSATYTSDVMRLAEQWTKDPHHMEIEPETVESASVNQKIFLVTTDEKFPLLYNLITLRQLTKVLVFTNRRDQARRLSERLCKLNIKADLLSGEVAQNKRIRALEDFRSGKVEVLVATDVAARGIHIDEISHVINYTLPQDPEHYVHRIGRTGRAGATGTSVSFACEDDSYYIPAIEELLGHPLHCEYPADELLEAIPSARARRQPKANKSQNAAPSENLTDAPETPATDPDSQEPTERPKPSARKRSKTPHHGRHNNHRPQKSQSPWFDPQALEEGFEEDEGFEENEEVPVQEAPVQEAPAQEAPVQEAPVQAAPVQEAPAQDAPAQEAPVQEAPVQEAPVQEAPVQEAPVQEARVQEAPVQDAPAQEAPVQEAPVQDAPAQEAPVQEAPVQEAPVQEAPAQDAPAQEAPVQEAPVQEAPAQEAPAQEAPALPRRPKAPRPVRQTRRPNTSKYRKRPASKYGKNPRSDK